MRVAVGSTNPAKVDAVRKVLEETFPGVHVQGVKVSPEVSPQPMSLSEIVRGAVNRARHALQAGDFDLGVGIEAGLVPVKLVQTGFVDVEWCAIIDMRGHITFGHSSGFEFPRHVIEAVLKEGNEIGEVMERISGIKDIHEQMGAIGYLSNGRLNRVDFTAQAVFMAMLPRLNPKLYKNEVQNF